MKVTVRPATQADAELLSTLNADVQTVHAAALPERFKRPNPDLSLATEARVILTKPDDVVFLALLDEAPAGYAYAEIVRRPETSLTYPYETIHAHHIGVRPQYRRQGVGSALLSAVRASGRDLGIELLTLDVWSFNEDARAFFGRHDFCQYIERLMVTPLIG